MEQQLFWISYFPSLGDNTTYLTGLPEVSGETVKALIKVSTSVSYYGDLHRVAMECVTEEMLLKPESESRVGRA